MKASDYIAAELARRQVPAVFELVGGMITHLLDSLFQNGGVRIVSMHHEQGAAFAAEAAGRITGIPGVAMATSGPGATNLLTGIGSCYFDSTPAVFITGQVNRHEQKGSRAVRQLGFQETDIVSMARPVTKAAYLVNDAKDLPRLLDEAFALAVSGRPGPVLLDIPMDVQREQVEPPAVHTAPTPSPDPRPEFPGLRAAIAGAQRPMILAGGGVRGASATDAFRRLVDAAGIPVVHSLMGVDLLRYDHPLNVGMIGSYGNRWANLALSRADVLLVLGSRLDVRQTGADTKGFRGGRSIFHVDIESGEMNNRIEGCETVLSHLGPAVAALSEELAGVAPDLTAWRGEIAELRRQSPDIAELAGVPGINPNQFMHQLSHVPGEVGAYVLDVGQHQMWGAQSLELTDTQRFLTSGGMGSMGFALPAGIGAAVALGRPVVVIAGDGGFQCNIQELETVSRFHLPVKIVIINNQTHGMVRQFQESYFHGRYQSTLWGYSAPAFRRVAEAYEIPARTVTDPGEVEAAVRWLHEDPAVPALLEVMVDTGANAYPKLAFGHGLASMEPQVKPLEMEGT